jgi:dienelactone hydrolase
MAYVSHLSLIVAALIGAGEVAWSEMEKFFQPPKEYQHQLGDYRSVMTFDDGTPVRTPQDWPRRREEIRKYWHSVMGQWPAVLEKPQIKFGEKDHVENFTRRHVEIEVSPGRLAATPYLLIPDGPGPFPAVLVVWYNSVDSAGLTKVERYRGILEFGYDLAKRGFVTLCVGGDVGRIADGDVRSRRARNRIQPLSYLAYTAANCCNALAELPQVDAKRIGIVGHSFGGKWAMFASCLYDKFACAVWSDPGIVWNEKDPNANYWEDWYLGYDFDKPADQQRKRGIVSDDNLRVGAYQRLVAEGRDLNELHALMAPRPLLVSGGVQDRPVHWTALNHTIALNQFLGYSGRVAMTMRNGHRPTLESNAQVYAFFEHFLKAAPASK